MTKAIYVPIVGISIGISLLFSPAALAANKNAIAFVEMLKGRATQLPPHSESAKALQVGDSLLEDTSILTDERSFVRIKFNDGSLMNIGSSSKVVLVEMTKNEVSLISLLKGKVRTKVTKEAEGEGENKFFIKTRSAALGVRGTDFQATYNPDNKLTSLVTLEGEVAMVKIDELNRKKLDILEKAEEEKIVERNEETNKVEIDLLPVDSTLQLNHLDKILATEDAVLVQAGQYSGSSDTLSKTTVPVKINPVQFELLLKNETLNEKKIENVTPKSILVASTNVGKLMMDSKAPPEGYFDPKTGEFAPKAGGVVDFESGLYVAPDKSASFDQKNKVYVSENIGAVDKETGQYVAPKGLKLDSVKGFVVTDTVQDPSLIALKEDLNKESITKDVVIGVEAEEPFKLENKFVKDELQFGLLLGGMSRKVNMETSEAMEKDSESYSEFRFKWALRSSMRFRPILGLNFKKFDFAEDSRFVQGDHSAFDIYTGAQYALSRKSNLLLHFGVKQDLFAVHNGGSPTNYSLVRMGITELGVGGDFLFDLTKRLSLYVKVLPYFAFSRDVGLIGAESSFGYQVEVAPRYYFSDTKSLNFGISFDAGPKTTTSSSGKSESDNSNGGLLISYQYQM